MDNFIVNITLELKFTIVKCFIKLTTENNHLGGGGRGKSHLKAGLQFYKFGFNCFTTYKLQHIFSFGQI